MDGVLLVCQQLCRMCRWWLNEDACSDTIVANALIVRLNCPWVRVRICEKKYRHAWLKTKWAYSSGKLQINYSISTSRLVVRTLQRGNVVLVFSRRRWWGGKWWSVYSSVLAVSFRLCIAVCIRLLWWDWTENCNFIQVVHEVVAFRIIGACRNYGYVKWQITLVYIYKFPFESRRSSRYIGTFFEPVSQPFSVSPPTTIRRMWSWGDDALDRWFSNLSPEFTAVRKIEATISIF